ncbi:TetR/AcrR family transcriptional regulator [Kitasatospora sp. A2-31]|uniref:TetR/AcrR family transcriptional regulator n=1 Tax=Kitasatospora sp. A2-31 TaxID=2916414 RepID=UPI001EEAE180|nr:TetR/AcrR family transcriptional regulator [Kitasatospora sp. A2-31]MCG6493945.1 TetR/AcrR family transcriptional regulator [Kitasatospora sp. A2-31]
MPTKRKYVSPRREEAAAQTRAQILRSATRLFAERGYGRVTVADIAAEAGVSSKAVFASAGSKGDILNEIVDTAVRASGYEQAMRTVLAEQEPEAVLRALAHGTRAGNEGMFTVHEAIHKALPSHEDGEALWERATADYRAALRAAAGHLHGLAPLAWPEEETADLLWFWFGPGGWRTLVAENGWPWDRAEAFLLRTALATLRAS